MSTTTYVFMEKEKNEYFLVEKKVPHLELPVHVWYVLMER